MAKKNDPGSNLTSDISKLPPQQYFDVSWESKGDLVRGYGTQEMTQPSDGDLADQAFERLGEPLPTYTPAPQASAAPTAMSDGEAADLAFRGMGK
jgi:hypothetical protein